MTVSQPENNNYPWGFGALHKTSHTDVLRRSRAVNDDAKYKQAWCSCRADVLLIKGGFICIIPVKPSHSIVAIWGPVHTIRIYIFFKSEIYLSMLAFRPHVIGIFGRRRSRFSQMFPRVEILEKDLRMDEYRGLRIQHCSVNGCCSYFNHFSVFMWTGEKDSNTLRVDAYFGYVWTGPYCF